MFSISKKNNPSDEKPKVEEPLVKKLERMEELPVETSSKKNEVRVGESATVTGTIKGNCATIIEGCFEGNVDIEADLIISRTGSLQADVKAKNTFISGKIEGTVYATECIQLMPTAVVNGNIKSKILVIERGAKFTGQSSIIEPEEAELQQPAVDIYYSGGYSVDCTETAAEPTKETEE